MSHAMMAKPPLTVCTHSVPFGSRPRVRRNRPHACVPRIWASGPFIASFGNGGGPVSRAPERSF
eukprot:7391691-Prymnesium_polylepis.1